MTYRRWYFFLSVCFTIFLAFELWAVVTGTPTLSQTVWAATDWWQPLALIACFALGLLCGHFWAPRKIYIVKHD
jgi:hypothetical protein